MSSGPPYNFTGTDTNTTWQGTLAVTDDGSGNYGSITAQGVNLANGNVTPTDCGLLAWTADPAGLGGTKLAVAGTIYPSNSATGAALLAAALY